MIKTSCCVAILLMRKPSKTLGRKPCVTTLLVIDYVSESQDSPNGWIGLLPKYIPLDWDRLE